MSKYILNVHAEHLSVHNERNGISMMKERLKKIMENARTQIDETDSLERLNEIKVGLLGKKGELTEVLKGMKDVAPEERPQVGQIVNETRQAIEEMLENARTDLAKKKREFQMKEEVIDVSLPAIKNIVGHRHPNTIALDDVEKIFVGMGYEVVEGPEVEYDYYNFEALNIPANHPAKDEQDTFYINSNIVLRTQTSSTQVHEMEKGRIPIRMIAPGRVFRADEVDTAYLESQEFLQRCSKLRGSVMLVGPLLARFGRALISKPGGDKIGRRRLDTHFLGISKLGAEFTYDSA